MLIHLGGVQGKSSRIIWALGNLVCDERYRKPIWFLCGKVKAFLIMCCEDLQRGNSWRMRVRLNVVNKDILQSNFSQVYTCPVAPVFFVCLFVCLNTVRGYCSKYYIAIIFYGSSGVFPLKFWSSAKCSTSNWDQQRNWGGVAQPRLQRISDEVAALLFLALTPVKSLCQKGN